MVDHGGAGLGCSIKNFHAHPTVINQEEPDLLSTVLQRLIEQGSSGFAEGIRILVNGAMLRERANALQAEPYPRCEERLGHANGFQDKTLVIRVGPITFKVSQVRGGLAFYPSSLEKGIRSEQALKAALAEVYVQGVSTRKVSAIVEDLCGSPVSSSQVNDCAAKLDATLSPWRERPLGPTPYVFLAARCEKVPHGGHFIDCAVLIALGIGSDGKRSIRGVRVALSEDEVHWRQFLTNLQLRGLTGVELIVSDDHAGLGTARGAVFPSIPWQRCQFHLQQNAQAHVPRLDQRAAAAEAIRSIFLCPDHPSAMRRLKEVVAYYATSAPKLAAWIEENIPQGLVVHAFPKTHQKRLRTSNLLERINQELKRRTRVVRFFPNEALLLRLISALLAEITEEWDTRKLYLNMAFPIPQAN
jgi:putative transposase